MESPRHPRITMLTVCAALVFPWLIAEPFVLSEGRAPTLLGVTVGGVGLWLVALAVIVPWFRPAIACVGLMVALSAFFIGDSVATTVSHLLAGLMLIVTGWVPGVVRFQAPAGAVDSAHMAREPLTPRPREPELPLHTPEPAAT